MKKAKAAAKNSNKIKPKHKASVPAGKPSAAKSKVLGKMKSLAKGLVKAMAPKSAKKPMTKSAPKSFVKTPPVRPAAAPKASVGKKIEVAKKVPAHTPALKPAPKKEDVKPASFAAKGKAKEIPAASASKSQGMGKPAVPPSAATKSAPIVAAVLTKGKGEPKVAKGKAAKLTGAQLAEHLEKMCRETGCENLSSTKGYCRLDYIKNWKKIKRKEMILKEGKLNQYIEELVSKYPEKYIDVIRQDLTTEVNFNKVIHDLELDESIDDLDYDGDSIDALIGGIKKEVDDFGGDDEF